MADTGHEPADTGHQPADTGHASPPADDDAAKTAQWRSMLLGTDPSLREMRSFFRRLPRGPRCKVCASPFAGPGRILTNVMQHGRSTDNPMLCNACFGSLMKQTGGADVEISVLFADVRGSTGIAERTSSDAFRRLLQRFYEVAASAIDHHDGIIDKFLGDGVMALFIPVLTGENHEGRAIDAALELLRMAERRDLVEGGVRVGAGVQAGSAFVGVIGSGSKLDFSALGDTVNVAARLGSAAGPGELLVSADAWQRAGRADDEGNRRAQPISGRAAPLQVVSIQAGR